MRDPTIYFKRDGTPADVDYFERSFEENDRVVTQTKLPWGGLVSTVFLCLDHSFGGGRPLIFETMVFSKKSCSELDMDRYATEEEARAGHEAMVRKWKRRKPKKL